MSWIVPEQEIQRALVRTMDQVRATYQDDSTPDFLRRVYGNLSDQEFVRLEAWFAAHDVPVVYGYPRDEQAFPCWVVLINPEDNTQQYVGDGGRTFQHPYGEQLIETAERWNTTIAIVTYAENADLVRWLYQLAKWSFASLRDDLDPVFPHLQRMSGRDLEPVRLGEGGGRFVYRRALLLTVEFDQTDADRTVVQFDLAVPAGRYGSTVTGETLTS